MNKLLFAAVFVLLISAASVCAVPAYKDKYVNDFAGIFGAGEAGYLKGLLGEVEQNTTAEAVVVSSNECNGDAFSYAMEIFDAWKIGKASKDNGLLILYCKPENKIWVTTGYGLEGILPDAKIGRMLDDYYVPLRDSGNVTAGIISFSTQAASVINANAEEVRAGRASSSSSVWGIFAIVVVLIIILIVFIGITKSKKETKNEAKKEMKISSGILVSDANSWKRIIVQIAVIIGSFILLSSYENAMGTGFIILLFILWFLSGIIAGFIFPPKCSKCGERLKFWKNESVIAYYKCSNGHVLKKQGRGTTFIPVPIGGGGGHGGFGGGGFGGGGSGGGGAGR